MVETEKKTKKTPSSAKKTTAAGQKSPAKTAVKTLKAKKETKTKEELKDSVEATGENDGRYLESVGRRKTAVAVVRLFTKGKKEFTVNNKTMEEYFPTFELRELCSSALKKMKFFDKFKVTVRVSGGGANAQAEAIRHGTARALVLFNPDFKKRLRRIGYLTRDPRQRERKKFGLKRARRAPQWKKR